MQPPQPHMPDRREGAQLVLLTVVLALACALMNVDSCAQVRASAQALAPHAEDRAPISRAAFSHILHTRHTPDLTLDEATLYTRYLAFVHDPVQVRAIRQRLRTDATLRAIAARPHDPDVITLTIAWIALHVPTAGPAPLPLTLARPGRS